ncbi:transcriptional regulator [Lysobacteraceae bacterium NML120232]|nr:transcriptional regulator [Xanthomonadaceae bacterium NML08-0793]PJK13000.1 transcriptional regulator [Xanthomonadaceae bacterium NML120232]
MNIPDEAEILAHVGEATALLKALANENRLLLLCRLVNGEQSVSALHAGIALSQPALSQHLAILRNEGLVSTRREAQTIYYSLADGPAKRVLGTLHAIYCAPESST